MARQLRGNALAVVLAGLIALDIALLSPLTGLTAAAIGSLALVGGLLAVAGGGLLAASARERAWQLGLGAGLLPTAVLALAGWRTQGQVGEFSDLAAAVTYMMALGAYVLFLAVALWHLRAGDQGPWLGSLLAIAGLSVPLGFLSVRWGSGEVAAALIVGVPLVALTLATGGLLVRAWRPSRS